MDASSNIHRMFVTLCKTVISDKSANFPRPLIKTMHRFGKQNTA